MRDLLFLSTVQNLNSIVEHSGFAIVSQCLDDEAVRRSCTHFDATQESQRNLLSVAIVRQLATSNGVRQLADTVLGSKCFAVRGIFFNKTEQSNWTVPWHQDLTIAVRDRASTVCASAKPRRVVHLEFAAEDLPQGLEWHEKVF